MTYKNIFSTILLLQLVTLNTLAQERVMTVHLNNGATHQYIFADVDSVSFAELAEVLPPIEEGTQLMAPGMLNNEECAQYYSLTDHYFAARNKSITEYVFGSSVAGQYALMPLDKEKMVMLYGGGKYLVTKYGTNHAEALYDEDLNPVCAFSIDRANATYEKNTMSYTIDLSDKEGVFYLRRFTKLSYASRSSVVVIEDFTPKGRTSDTEILSANIARFQKAEQGIKIPIQKTMCRVSFDFTIDKDANTDAESFLIADFDMVGNNQQVQLLRRAAQPMKVRYYGDKDNIEKADAQTLAFRSGFVIGKDTIVRSQDFYKPLAGETNIMLWLMGKEYEEEPTADILAEHEASLIKYENYYISLQNNELTLWEGENIVSSIAFTSGMTIQEMCHAISEEPAFKDFMVHPLVDNTVVTGTLMQFPKIKLVGKYYQSLDITKSGEISSFNYHYDSFPIVLHKAIDTTTHTFDAICTNDGVFVGIDGNFKLLDYDIIRNIYINPEINISNIDVIDGAPKDILQKFSSTSRLSEAHISTPRSPYLLGLMGHHVEADSPEGSVPRAASDVSSGRLQNMCQIMKEEGYKTLNMDDLVSYMDKGMKSGKYAFFMFDDFKIDVLYLTESTRNIFIENGIKTNLALIQSYLWDGFANKAKGKYIEPMKALGWSCVSHSLRHNQPTGKKPSIYINYELQRVRKDCEKWGMNSEVFVYNWDGTWEATDILFKKNGFKYAINSRGTYTTKGTNPYRLGRTSFQEALPFTTVEKILRW